MPTFSAAARRRLRHLLAAGLLLLPPATYALPEHSPVPGGVAVLALDVPAGHRDAPTVSFDGLPQAVVREHGRWFALIGISLDAVPGPRQAEVALGAAVAGGRKALHFEVRAKRYPTQHLRFTDQRLVEPPPELAMRIAAEQQQLAALKRHFAPDREPETEFELPAEGRLSSRFGVRRVLNGQPRSPHAGLDVAVGTGTRVRAPAPGMVIAVEDFHFTGRTVVIDHGRGLLTLYAHLSEVAVDAGQALRRGDPIGRSGASGRATGPHLHWGVVLGGSSVDPQLFLRRR